MTWKKCARSCDQESLGEGILASQGWLLSGGVETDSCPSLDLGMRERLRNVT